MFCRMVRKEILENLLGVRLVLSLVLILGLFTTSTVIFLDRHRGQMDDYRRRVNEDLSAFRARSDQLYRLAFHKHQVYRKPKVLTLCAGGSEEVLPGHFTFDGFEMGLPQIAGQSNFTLPRLGELDWTFVISMVLSFMALVFSYNCICGEKERGTIRLILAGTAPRATVLLAKYVGLMLILAIPLLLGLSVSLIVLIASGAETVRLIPWLRIVGVVLTSFLYLSILVLLGLCVSARTSRSCNSMAKLLLAWVVLLILIPSLGRVISDRFYRAATPEEFVRARSEAERQVEDRLSSGAYGPNAGATGADRDDPNINPVGRARYTAAWTEARNRVVDAHHHRMLAQAEAGRNFTGLSPAVVFRRVCEIWAGTGLERSKNLHRQIRAYQQALRDYILQEDRNDPDSLHLFFDDEPRLRDWMAISHRPVNFAAVPKFQERDLPLGASLKLAVWDIGLLALFNLVFFAAAFVSFLHYDVR